LVLPFCYQLTCVVPEKGLLNVCVLCACSPKVPDADSGSSRAQVKLLVDDHNASAAGKSAVDCDRLPTPMQSSESMAEGPGAGGKGPPAAGREICEPAVMMKPDRHIADMATLTVDDMVRVTPSLHLTAALCH